MYNFTPLLTTYAYNIVGSLEDAKDIVQDAFLKIELTDKNSIHNEKSYLIRTVINLSINFKKRQKLVLSEYPGQWLPEPVSAESAGSAIERKEILSYSLMVLLEKLNPRQRAVFILKEAFDYEHEEIAEVLGIGVDNSRQILNRARKQLQANPSRANKKVQAEHLNKYLDIIQTGDTLRLEEFLNEEITIISDGGGKASAFINPITGRRAVSAVLNGIYKKSYPTVRIEKAWVNREPALLYYANNVLVTCQILIFNEGMLEDVFFIRNPDKLKFFPGNP